MTPPPDETPESAVPPVAAWRVFTENILNSPWGSTSKSELEFQIFQLFIRSGELDSLMPDGELAARLQVPLARVRALRYRLDQQSVGPNFIAKIVASLEIHRIDGESDAVHLAIDSRYLRERFIESLRSNRLPVRRELAGELLRVKISDLVWFFVMHENLPHDEFKKIAPELNAAWAISDDAKRQRKLNSLQGRVSGASDTVSLLAQLFGLLKSVPGV